MKGLEDITNLIARYTAVEAIYLTRDDITLKKEFEDAVISLYARILEYQANAACYFGRNTFVRFLRNIPKMDKWVELLTEIRGLDAHCRELTEIFDSKDQKKVNETLKDILDGQDRQIYKLLGALRDEDDKNKEIIRWVSDIEVVVDHDRVREKLGPSYWNSGGWLLTRDEFIRWKEAVSGVFWLQGSVGVGKSCLTSIVIQQILEAPDQHLAYFYCSKESQRSNHTDILCSLVAQLSSSSDGRSVAESVKEQYELGRRSGHKLSPGDCVKLLVEIIQLIGQTTIIIDGLDESFSPYELLHHLKRVRDGSANIRLFISSRPNVDVASCFHNITNVTINSQENSKDIESFIKGELENEERRCRSGMTEQLAEQLLQTLTSRAQGM
jgi:N-terminal domain of NWD NACHT-NTPase/NACHT domain